MNTTKHHDQRLKGAARLLFARKCSLAGLRVGWSEPAFRQEVLVAAVLLPAAFWLGQNWVERSLLVGSVFHVLSVEMLNTAVERAVDRVGPEWHPLSKVAKDTASAAVLISLLLAGGIWVGALVR